MPTEEMFTVEQAAQYIGGTEGQIKLMIREGALRAWSLPMQRGLLVRKSDLQSLKRAGEEIEVEPRTTHADHSL